MKFLLLLLCLLPATAIAARKPLSYPKSHNFRLSSAASLRAWLLIPELGGAPQRTVRLLFADNPEVPGTYRDIKSKDIVRIQRRLETLYGHPVDAEAKIGLSLPFGAFEQSFAMNGAAAMLVNDPVFPELNGILFNDYTLTSAYAFRLPQEIEARAALNYGLRRVMEQSFTVGALLGSPLNTKLKTYPYRFYSELSLSAERRFASLGTFGFALQALPVYQKYYDYWAADLSWRSTDLLAGTNLSIPKKAYLWAGVSPFFGGAYNWARTFRLGTSVAWFPFLRTDLFVTERFLLGGVISGRIGLVDLELFTFERAEDEHKIFKSRQYGAALSARF